MTSFWSGRTVAVTGASGSFGSAFIRFLLAQDVRAVRAIARGEKRLAELDARLDDRRVRIQIGDVVNRDAMRRRFDGCSVVVHAAALKRVDLSEYNAIEFTRTNTMGAVSVVEAALDAEVERVVALSTDKASAPVTHYGITKAAAERVFLAANAYGGNTTVFLGTRYGNVFGSAGSVLSTWIEQRDAGVPLTMTDIEATRFWMTMNEAVALVDRAARDGLAGTIIIPKLPAVRMVDVAEAIAPGHPTCVIGMRGVEKVHESLISEDEAPLAMEYADHYLLGLPGASGIEGRYASDNRGSFLTVREIAERIPQAMAEAQ